jgi:hypothetical protein
VKRSEIVAAMRQAAPEGLAGLDRWTFGHAQISPTSAACHHDCPDELEIIEIESGGEHGSVARSTFSRVIPNCVASPTVPFPALSQVR